MAANAAAPAGGRPSAATILMQDAGLSLLGAGVAYPALYLALGAYITSDSAAVAEPLRAGAMVSASVLAVVFLVPLWLTGPQSLIGRMMVFALLAGSIFGSHLLEAMLHKTVSADKAVPLTAIAMGTVLVLFSAGWLMRCLGVGRSGQYGFAALTGSLMIGTIPYVLPIVNNVSGTAARKSAIEWIARANPLIASFETVEFKGWMRSNTNGFADYATGEALAADLGVPADPAPEAESKPKPGSKVIIPDEEVRRQEQAAGGKSSAPPIWLKSAPLLTVAGAAVWTVAAFIGWVRQRLARAAAAA